MILVKPVLAQCPVCIVTVGGGMLIAKRLGIDDFLVSLWISALNTVIAFWLAPKLRWKIFKNPYLLSLAFLLLTLFYFQYTGQMGPGNDLLGLNKILFGQTLGMLAIFAGNYAYAYAKTRNHHRALFPYSKVVFPFGTLLLLTLVFKFAYNL